MFGTLAMAFTIALAGGTTLYPPVGGYVPVGFGAYYGAFHDVTPIQSLPSPYLAAPIELGVTESAAGVEIENNLDGNPTRIKVTNSGIYNIQFSIQFAKTTSQAAEVELWLTKNRESGNGDVDASAGYFTVPGQHGALNGHEVAAYNLFTDMEAGDYVEFMWYSADPIGIIIETVPAIAPVPGVTPGIPASPGAIVTVTQVR